jgi:hypothetical protein
MSAGRVVSRAGHDLIALVNEQAEGMCAPSNDAALVWREAPEKANAHIEVAVADAGDGRFLPGLTVDVTVLDGDTELPDRASTSAGAPRRSSTPRRHRYRWRRSSAGSGRMADPAGW